MRRIINSTLLVALFTIISFSLQGQAAFDPVDGCVKDRSGNCIPNTVVTAMPFLRIVPDARGGAMGDAGIAASPTGGSMHFNASNLVFAEKKHSVGFTYTPWLRDLQLDDVYLLYFNGYTKLDESQTLGASIRYFSLGEIQFTDGAGEGLGLGMPREAEFAIAYARKLGDNFSAALTGKYAYSNLATGTAVGPNGTLDVETASTFGADVSMTYKNDMTLGGYKSQMTYGLAITNIGAKVTYIKDNTKDFIPTNLGLGVGLNMDFDDYNRLGFVLDFNKLMVPSPISRQIENEDGELVNNPEWSTDGDLIADYRQKGLFDGMFGSFSDAQGGFKEELKEVAISFGTEYLYNKQLAIRAGYYYEHAEKGGRNFLTLGLGLQYNVFTIDLAYLAPTSNQRSPLDNTFRFGLTFDLEGTRNTDN